MTNFTMLDRAKTASTESPIDLSGLCLTIGIYLTILCMELGHSCAGHRPAWEVISSFLNSVLSNAKTCYPTRKRVIQSQNVLHNAEKCDSSLNKLFISENVLFSTKNMLSNARKCASQCKYVMSNSKTCCSVLSNARTF